MPSRISGHRLLLIAYAVLTGGLAVAAGLLSSMPGIDPLGHFTWISVASVVVIGSLVAMSGVWTAVGMYALVFWCFHFGLIAVLATGYADVEDLSVWDLSWLLGPHAAEAAVVALARDSRVCVRRDDRLCLPPPLAVPHQPGPNRRSPLILTGLPDRCWSWAALAMWSAIVLATGGLGGFFVSYGDYLQATARVRRVAGRHLAGARLRPGAVGHRQDGMAADGGHRRLRVALDGGAPDGPPGRGHVSRCGGDGRCRRDAVAS